MDICMHKVYISIYQNKNTHGSLFMNVHKYIYCIYDVYPSNVQYFYFCTCLINLLPIPLKINKIEKITFENYNKNNNNIQHISQICIDV